MMPFDQQQLAPDGPSCPMSAFCGVPCRATAVILMLMGFLACTDEPTVQEGSPAVLADMPSQLSFKTLELACYTEHVLGDRTIVTYYSIQSEVKESDESRLPTGPCYLVQQTSLWVDPLSDTAPIWTAVSKYPLRYEATDMHSLIVDKLVVTGQSGRGEAVVEVLEMDSPVVTYDERTGKLEAVVVASISDTVRVFASTEQEHQFITGVLPEPSSPQTRVLIQFHSSGDILSVGLTEQGQHHLVASPDSARAALEPNTAVHAPELDTYRFLASGGRHTRGVDYVMSDDHRPFRSALVDYYGRAPATSGPEHNSITFGLVLIDADQNGIFEASNPATHNFFQSVNWSKAALWEY